MSKELEALETVFKDIEQCSIDLARADLDEYKLIEAALKEHEQYKAVEKELGVDLKILLKAFKKVDDYYNKNEVVYMKSHDGEIFAVKGISLHYCPCRFFITPNYDREGKSQFMTYWLKDYGKTWALTKEELEKK